MPTPPDDLPDMTQEELEAAKGKPDIVVDPVQELAKMSPLEYDRVREDKAKELGVRVSTLDKEVAKARGEYSEKSTDSVVEEISPWCDPVDGSDLLTALAATLKHHTVLPIWCLGSYCMDAWSIWAKLHIYAAHWVYVSGFGRARKIKTENVSVWMTVLST